jgi:predicted dehydrogenase
MTHADVGLVVGGGSIGQRHTQNLQDLGVKVAVTDPSAAVRDEVASELNVPTFPELSGALETVEPDFVVVCAPNRHHVGIATEAARADCHVFIEKPLSHDMAGVSDLETVLSTRDLVSLVGCNLRFHPALKKIHHLLQDDVIGPVVAARIEGGSYLPEWFPDTDYRESYSAREELGGGVILDYIHEINYARWFFGEFDTISAMAGQRTHLEVETNDVAGILAETRQGVLCEFHLDYVQRSYSRSCHIIGEEGTIRWSFSDECVEWYLADSDEWYSFEQPEEYRLNDMYLEEMRHFLSCVRNHDETICPVDCGRKDLAVALTARKAANSGHHVSVDSLET